MVRLKETGTVMLNIVSFHFNSSMVRLKDTKLINAVIKQLFQFQYGTIKSPLPKRKYHIQNNFNSSMVRLKVLQDYHS